MAQSWDAGIYPYRDIRAFNFPGHIYLHLFVGKTIGWGHPAAFYAVDAALLLALGAALVAWGRQRFGAILPGLLAYLAFVTQYLSLDYTQVAQRDWHAILLVVLALMTLQIAGSRRSRVTSGLLAAFAFVFRPHVLLFLGAFWSAIDEHLQERPRRETRRARAFVEWSAGFALGLLFGFAPLVLAGVLPDFIGGLSVGMYGGPHVVTTPAEAFFGFLRQLGMKWTLIGVSAGPLLAIYGSPEWRRTGRTWSLAMTAALLYKPVHPIPHDYLLRPLELVSAVNVGLLAAWVRTAPPLNRASRHVAIAAVVVVCLSPIPRYCSIEESMRAIALTVSGELSDRPPSGSREWLHERLQRDGYRWASYRDALNYVRTQTSRDTLVANVLRRYPFPSLNGPTGRLSPFMTESGICWMFVVDQDLDAVFAESLHRATAAIVVWAPGELGVEPRMQLSRVVGVVRRDFEFRVRFGQIEIWTRRNGVAATRGIAER
jgi:hypothetical protein